jgi:transcription-repair coupling factor (superfamily II helicase)
MEMYKKISLIAEPCDMQDVLDELIDRFGEPPGEVMRLLSVSLMRSLASKCEIRKVELKDATLTFAVEKPNLAIWSELFGTHRGLTFKSVGSPSVVYRLKSGADACAKALAILEDYYNITMETKEEKE